MFGENLETKNLKVAVAQCTINDGANGTVHSLHETIGHTFDKVAQDFRPPVGESTHEKIYLSTIRISSCVNSVNRRRFSSLSCERAD